MKKLETFKMLGVLDDFNLGSQKLQYSENVNDDVISFSKVLTCKTGVNEINLEISGSEKVMHKEKTR